MEKVRQLLSKGQLDGSKFNFLVNLLSRKEITAKEAIVLCMSLQADGLTAVISFIFNLPLMILHLGFF